jgi:hypothetical protein
MLEAEQETDWWNQISVQEKASIHEAIKQLNRGK